MFNRQQAANHAPQIQVQKKSEEEGKELRGGFRPWGLAGHGDESIENIYGFNYNIPSFEVQILGSRGRDGKGTKG